MKTKIILVSGSLLLMYLFIGGAVQVFASTSSWQGGGYYNGTGNTGSWAESNTPPILSGSPLDNTFVWQGSTTDTNYFYQEVIRMMSNGWRVEFWSFNPSGNVVDQELTNTYQTPGCTQQYGQEFQSTNDFLAFILGAQSSGCSSWSQTWQFDDASYGTFSTTTWLPIESYDYTCSDFNGFGSLQFTQVAYQQNEGSIVTPYVYPYFDSMPSCFSVTVGSGFITISYS